MNKLLVTLFSANGRIRRSQFWVTRLCVSIAWLISLAVVFLPCQFFKEPPTALYTVLGGYCLVSFGVVLWIDIVLLIKRWHDRNKSGLWCLLLFVPVIGWWWLLIECGFIDGTQGPNTYGPSPKGIGAAPGVF